MKKRRIDEDIYVGMDAIASIPANERWRIIEVETMGSIAVARVYLGDESMLYDYLAAALQPPQAASSTPAPKYMTDEVYSALETTINTDPFGGRYTAMPLRVACADEAWRKRALRELKNEYLRSRVKTIDEFIKAGGDING